MQWLTHVAEITLVDKKSKKNCLTAKFWQKMPQCSLANVWRIYTAGILRVGSGWIGTVSVFEISCINKIWIKLIFCVEFVFNMTFFSYLHMFRVAAVMRVLRLILRPVLTASRLRAREVFTESPPLRKGKLVATCISIHKSLVAQKVFKCEVFIWFGEKTQKICATF